MITLNIIKIETETHLDICSEEYGITYLGTEIDIVKHLKALEDLDFTYNIRGERVPELSDFSGMVRTWLGSEEKVNELVKELQDYYIEEDYLRYYATLEDFLSIDPEFFIEKILDAPGKVFEFFESNGLQIGTVGYSPWSNFIAPMDVSKSFIRDLWEGWNFYTLILLDENGEVKDSSYEVYIPDTEELKEVVYNYFGITDFYLVDNNEASYMDIKKVREIPKVDLSYKII